MHSVSAVPGPTVRAGDAGIWWGGRIKVVVVVGHLDRKCEAEERGLGAKYHETERDGSISGAPCEKAVEGDEGRWWHSVDEVVVVVGLRVRKREAGEGAGGQKPRNQARWLDFGRALRNGGGG
jgi:hypothetical protein